MGSSVGSDTTKTALVVGAGSGIGRATAQLLADRGVHVLAADVNVEAVRDLARDEKHVAVLGDRSWDATDVQACSRMVELAAEEAGGLDAVVSTVGWTAVTPFLDETPEYWRRIIDLNLLSAIYISAAAARAMRGRGGTIVLTSSEAGKVGTTGESVYSAAKAGVIGLVKSLAREFAREDIRVNAVAPGLTETPLLASQVGDGILDRIVRQIPMRRVGSPEEIATAIAFLASDDASYVTGQTLCVGGGLTMGS
jgi:2-hydroxycyclohexanecarboxyl-CoA dehydrogenase